MKKSLVLWVVLLVTKAFSVTKDQLPYVKSKYEHKLFTKECLFYPAQQAKRMLVVFTSAVKDRYEMWSWFWREQEDWTDTSYLFLKDEDFCWYLGNAQRSFISDYTSIIQHFMTMSKLELGQVFTFGGSMGGYAALFYATFLGLKGAIAYNPQVNKVNATKFDLGNIGDKWQDLDRVVAQTNKAPCISLVFGNYSKDVQAAHDLIDVASKKNSLLIIRHVDHPSHKGLLLTKEFIETELAFLENHKNAISILAS